MEKEEWYITPPPGFRYDHLVDSKKKSGSSSPVQHIIAEELFRPLRNHFEMSTGAEITSLLKELSNSHRELANNESFMSKICAHCSSYKARCEGWK